ncbi:hypothetical protein ACLFKX_01830 [Enterobacter hormaechei]
MRAGHGYHADLGGVGAGQRLARFEQPVRWLALPPELKNGGIKISRQALKQWVNALLRG